MVKPLDILKSYGRPTPKEEAVLDHVLEKLGRNQLSAEDAVDQIMEKLDWPLERAAAEVDGYLE